MCFRPYLLFIQLLPFFKEYLLSMFKDNDGNAFIVYFHKVIRKNHICWSILCIVNKSV